LAGRPDELASRPGWPGGQLSCLAELASRPTLAGRAIQLAEPTGQPAGLAGRPEI